MSFPASKGNVKPRKMRKREFRAIKPQITSLIDVLILIIVFLIQSFSMEESAMNIPRDIMLPLSSAKKAPKSMPVIGLNNNALVADGQMLGLVSDMIASDELLFEPLYNWLVNRKEITEGIAKYSTKIEFKGEVAIQGDKKIPFKLLQKIMFTCGQVGYNNFSLAVTQRE